MLLTLTAGLSALRAVSSILCKHKHWLVWGEAQERVAPVTEAAGGHQPLYAPSPRLPFLASIETKAVQNSQNITLLESMFDQTPSICPNFHLCWSIQNQIDVYMFTCMVMINRALSQCIVSLYFCVNCKWWFHQNKWDVHDIKQRILTQLLT